MWDHFKNDTNRITYIISTFLIKALTIDPEAVTRRLLQAISVLKWLRHMMGFPVHFLQIYQKSFHKEHLWKAAFASLNFTWFQQGHLFYLLHLLETHNALQLPVFFFSFFSFSFFSWLCQNIGKFEAKNYFTDHRTANTIYGFRDSVPVLKIRDCY